MVLYAINIPYLYSLIRCKLAPNNTLVHYKFSYLSFNPITLLPHKQLIIKDIKFRH